MIKRLAHICIHTHDLEETGRYYFDGLGLEKGFEFIKNGALFGYYIKLGDSTFIEVFQGKNSEVGNINHLAIEVDDIDAVIARQPSYLTAMATALTEVGMADWRDWLRWQVC